LPDPRATAATWRREAEKRGLPGLYLVSVESNYVEGVTSPASLGFDATLRFQPDFTVRNNASTARKLAVRALKSRYPGLYEATKRLKPQPSQDTVYDYSEIIRKWQSGPPRTEPHFECVTPMWDNSARRYRGATIVKNSTPALYEKWLDEAVKRSISRGDTQPIVFINAWNEWAEGCHLEPCQRWGLQYLEATRRVYLSAQGASEKRLNDRP
jgi:hypothetical protein